MSDQQGEADTGSASSSGSCAQADGIPHSAISTRHGKVTLVDVSEISDSYAISIAEVVDLIVDNATHEASEKLKALLGQLEEKCNHDWVQKEKWEHDPMGGIPNTKYTITVCKKCGVRQELA